MHLPAHLQLLLALLPAVVLSYDGASQRPPGNKAILLSQVQTLTLRGDRLTSSRRVSPIPQLQCVGPSKRICDSYPIEIMRCTNAGHDYDEEDVQWTCTASLPPELKLGSTDVICEGYRNADDPWVLKGSCGVEYRLLLTDLGEKKFGRKHDDNWSEGIARHKWQKALSVIGSVLFYGFVAWVLIVMLDACFGAQGDRRRRTPGRGWGGFGGDGGGGGGGGGGGPFYDPPPPYSSHSDSSRGWRPGFWTGALGGGAAGYEYGRRSAYNSSRRHSPPSRRRNESYDPGEGSSRSPSYRFSDTTTTSTGFGSTRRR
ncbi:hypothetical protein P170DRAFT_437025 [Aspergillus steynii IBT 23096]|uniref:Store-operated calcium entry-associated regulatory factor n=1 Tax=Aspergillus steynii IBT 23096 TaxID=1392250 RepID=A0A2I2G993_9EURO|nr:uncharacterized protein P170DRAFT_437025 [Aspergillus steynii IBT 23096]PLB49454.1 hypothetical protein P170DRAFT_437025 [Aspergillus steynii IBT 23096]